MDVLTKIRDILNKGYSREEVFIPRKTKIPLSVPTYGIEEILETLESLLSTWVTMGKKVATFEKLFADYIGVKYAVMVNSGSSANLIALSILANPVLKDGIKRDEEIITPAVTWATTVYPIANVDAIPVLVDVDLNTYNISPEKIEEAITSKTKAIMLVHLLGNPCDMRKIREIAIKHDLLIIEDACEAHGAEYNGNKVGGFGDLSTFSFFMSHHISTIEGGMVLTNNEEFYELAKAIRAFGWIRDLKEKESIAAKYREIDKRFLFINTGYNFRPTEIQGAFGIHQMNRLEEYISIRRENARYWNNKLRTFKDCLILPEESENAKHVYFGYPITIKPEARFSRDEIVNFLESRMIETRPIMAGNMAEQPVMKLLRHKVHGELTNSKIIMRRSFFFGNHHGIKEQEREYIVETITEFINERTKK